ncbi:MAG: cysteine desulfurase family protein [Minisyncoccia bacterium]
MKWFSKKESNRRIHLDFAATTPVHPDVLTAMLPYFSEDWANPSAFYKEGVKARNVIEGARTKLARTLRVRASDIIFTSGGTESNNLALIGTVEALFEAERPYSEMEIISTRIEHPSILKTLIYLEKRGVGIKYAPIDLEGKIIIPEFEKLLSTKTVLVTFAYANSEIGVVQDVKKITRRVRAWNESNETKIATHLDASQAPLWLSCEIDMLGVDLVTLDAGKCYGPKGVGVLAKRHGVNVNPILHGGEQEQGLRAGTENTALVVGCVEALVRAQENYETRTEAATLLREYFFELLTREIPEIIINGSRDSRIANNVNISLPNFDTEYAVVWLDAKGIAASTKSACGTGGEAGSLVVREMTHDESRALSTLRFTLGEETTKADIEQIVEILKEFKKLMQGEYLTTL